MNEDQFTNFFILLGVSLFLIGSFSSFAADHYSDRLAAGELLPLTMCQEADGELIFAEENDTRACGALEGTEGLLEANCATLDTDRDACREMQLLMDSQLDGCHAGDREPADAEELDALCEATGVKGLNFTTTRRA